MSEAVEQRLRGFTRALLERGGGLVDWPADDPRGAALLPPTLAVALACPESVGLCAAADGAPPGALHISLASTFLDQVEPLVRAQPAAARLRIDELYLKRAAMEEPVSRTYTWQNARTRYLGGAPTRVEYHTWFFLATLESEERWEDLICYSCNAATGAPVDLPDPLTLSDATPDEPTDDPPVPADVAQAARRVGPLAAERASTFIARLESRRTRDRTRLRDYYHALLDERPSGRARTTVAARDTELTEKRRAVELELARKLLELDARYGLRARLEPLALVRLNLPALAMQVRVQRRQACRDYTVYWNALTKTLEPLACSQCGAGVFSVLVDEQTVQPRCPACAGRAPA